MRREFLIIGLCLVTIGCNADPRSRRETALLRAEILDLEDKYYLLKSERDLAVSELSTFQGEIIYESPAGTPIYSEFDSNIVTPPANQIPLDTGIPAVDPNDPMQIEINESDSFFPSDPSNPAELPEPDRFVPGGQSRTLLNGPESNSPPSTVAEIVIDKRQSQGQDVDGKPGDEGLNLLIQPKAFSGETLLQTGELTVSVIDPAEAADHQRVGLWKFLPAETKLFFANENRRSRGILLHLPWDQSTPRNRELVVFVRFKTADGRQLETSSKIRINPPANAYSADDPLVAGWTERDRRWSNSSGGAANRKSIKAIPASSGSARIQKPSWRPVR
jgi:hypothetical protein